MDATQIQLPEKYAAFARSAQAMLAEARNMDDVKSVVDKAEALRVYLRKHKCDFESQQVMAEISLRGQRRMGEILEGMELKPGRPSKLLHDATINLDSVGIDRTQSHRFQRIASIPLTDFEVHLAECRRAEREITTSAALKLAKKLAASTPNESEQPAIEGCHKELSELVGGNFQTVYADPPWQYGNQATRASTDNHYGTMSVDEICELPVHDIVADNAHLHLWTTNAFLFDAKRVIEAWGFTYKSVMVWVKPQMGIGNYWRVSHEFLLFGIRGECPFRARDIKSWVEAKRGKHSSKPEVFRQLIERASPGPYAELFGRNAVPGWSVWGNQIEANLYAGSIE